MLADLPGAAVPVCTWAEMAMSAALLRIRHQETAMAHGWVRIHDSYWTVPSIRTVKTVHNSEHIPRMDNTKLLNFRVIKSKSSRQVAMECALYKASQSRHTMLLPWLMGI